jgi:hypothetical protein
MISLNAWLSEIVSKVRAGEQVTETVRGLLAKFDAEKRGKHIVQSIRDALGAASLSTWPDFEDTFMDGLVEFRLHEDAAHAPPVAEVPGEGQQAAPQSAKRDPVPRLAQLKAANQTPLKVCRDDLIAVATTTMLLNNYSQLPVMQGERAPDGYISWETIGGAHARGRSPVFVRDAMGRAEVLPADTPLFDAIDRITTSGFVLVEGAGKRITGLVTTYDVSVQFHELSRPFLLVAQIEGHLRHLIAGNFTLDELRAVVDPTTPRQVDSVDDLTFGEYLRLLQADGNWAKIKTSLDRATMLGRLSAVREIRNDIMHFDPDPVDAQQLRLLDDTARCLADLVQ